jgi:hypothetical protein
MTSLRSRSFGWRLECLEAREVPAALQITFDYRFDTTGFFTDPTRRATLEQAGRDVASRLNNSVDLAAISPAGSNSWTATTFDPANPSRQVTVSNLSVGTDQVVVFVGAEAGTLGGEAGLGGYGGYSASGMTDWFSTLRSRGRSGFASWGGSIAFGQDTNWNFGGGMPSASQIDFYSVATHELGHVLGFGTSNQWTALVSGSSFTGATARAAYGSNPPVDNGHWKQGITAGGAAVSMQPYISAGTRVTFSELDYAALADIGWDVSSGGTSGGGGGTTSTTNPISAPQLGTFEPVVVGSSNGTFQVYAATGGTLTPVGSPVTPFAGFGGSIRTATGDLNGDGVADIAVGAGPGGGPMVKVYDGKTGAEVRSFFAYEWYFTGGVMLAAGDIDGDGRADLVVGADQGGGPRVRVFTGGDPAAVAADFWGIADANFRGGVRLAVGDVNADRRADLVVAAGYGGGPRVAIYDGNTVGGGQTPHRLVYDFFAYDLAVNNGAYVAVADLNGDGFGDVVFGAGVGAMHVQVISGATLTRTGDGAKAVAAPLSSYIVPQADGYTGGARVAAGDFASTGRPQVLVGTGGNAGGGVYLVGDGGTAFASAFGGSLMTDGVFVG